MPNLSQVKRERMLAFLQKIKDEHRDDDDMLIALGEIESELTSKKYGLVWEQHEEAVDVMMRDHIPVFTEVPEREITAAPGQGYNFILEGTDVEDMYIIGRTMRFSQSAKVDTPPQRLYNADVLDYYTMAMESKDPFSMYISFYHVIEHYFDAIFRKKLTEEIKTKITHPDFSYKSEDKLYELAKYIKKHLNSADDSGKGNEFESLKYVLMEYVPIAELKARINVLDSRATTFYQGNNVAFVTSKDTKIPWADSQGIYTKLAARIYETRNALVHSKSEQAANQYKPYENRKDLLLEIALIRAVAELVVVNSSEIL